MTSSTTVAERVAQHSRRVAIRRNWRPAAGQVDLFDARRCLPALSAAERRSVVGVYRAREGRAMMFELADGSQHIVGSPAAAAGLAGLRQRRVLLAGVQVR